MPYRVRAMPNGTHPGFRRDGRFFSSTEWTTLSDAEMTDAIRNEPMLIVVPAEPESAPITAQVGATGAKEYAAGIKAASERLAELAPQTGDEHPGHESSDDAPEHCTGTTQSGRPCQAKPVSGTDRCARHPHEE